MSQAGSSVRRHGRARHLGDLVAKRLISGWLVSGWLVSGGLVSGCLLGCSAPAPVLDAGPVDAASAEGGTADGALVDDAGDANPVDAGPVEDAGPPCPPPDEGGTTVLFDIERDDVDTFTAEAAIAATDGGLWIAGTHRVSTGSQSMAFRLDAEGELRWSVELPPGSSRAHGARIGADDLSVSFVNAAGALVLTRLDPEGRPRWTIERPMEPGVPYDVTRLAAGEAITLAAELRGTRREVHLARVSLDGVVLWERRIGVPGRAVGLATVQEGPQGILTSLVTDGFTARTYRAGAVRTRIEAPWVVHFDPLGEVTWDRYLELEVGNLQRLSIARFVDFWQLGGTNEAGTGRPWWLELSSASGRVGRSVVWEGDGVRGEMLADLDLEGLPHLVFGGVEYLGAATRNTSAPVMPLTALDASEIRVCGADGGFWTAGPVPRCDVRFTGRRFCGSTRLDLAVTRWTADLDTCQLGFRRPTALRRQPAMVEPEGRSFSEATGRLPDRFLADAPGVWASTTPALSEVRVVRDSLCADGCRPAFD